MDRRRLASLLAIAFAGAVSLATSSVGPTPQPIASAALDGSLELTADSRAAVQEFRVSVVGSGAGSSPSVSFKPTAVVSSSRDGAQLRLRVIPASPDNPPDHFESFRGIVAGQPRTPSSWRLTCSEDACEGRFALIAEWLDPDEDASATVDWRLDTTVSSLSVPAAGQVTATVTAETIDVASPTVTLAAASGAPVRFDARNRMAQWRVTMTLGDGAVDSSWGWPVTATGWLSPTKSIIESPPDGDAGDALLFVDGIGDQEGNLIEAQGLGEVIEFDPFWHCIPDEACRTEAIVGLTWPDGREGSAIEAGWDLDLRVIGVDGRSVPVTVEVEPAPAYGMLTGSTSGSLVWNEQSTPTFRYLASAPNPAKDEGNLDDFRVPSYAVWQATMRSTGSSTVPADFGVNFGSFGSDGYSRRIRIEDGQVQGGSLAMTQCPFSRFAECRIQAELGAGFSGDELPSGWEITIDWELELGVGTPDPAGGTLQILDVTNATPAPVP